MPRRNNRQTPNRKSMKALEKEMKKEQEKLKQEQERRPIFPVEDIWFLHHVKREKQNIQASAVCLPPLLELHLSPYQLLIYTKAIVHQLAVLSTEEGLPSTA